MSAHDPGEVLVGLDGGATKLAAHAVVATGDALELGPASAEERVPATAGFAPVPLEPQLAERDAPRIGALEREVGRAWVAAAARVVVQAAGDAARIRVGACMPGLKTADGRGICVLRHGPRMPRFAEELEREIASLGRALVAPIARLLGDGEACGIGERAARDGLFRGVEQAYYVGGGTGVAEAILLDGAVRTVDALGAPRAWEIRRADGTTVEDLVSMKGINTRYAALSGRDVGAVADRVEARAAGGERAAERALEDAAAGLAELIALRVESFQQAGGRRLQRVVLGQRTAALFADERLASRFRLPLERALADRVALEPESRAACRARNGIDAGFLRASTLRAAPAIGAAAAARGTH